MSEFKSGYYLWLNDEDDNNYHIFYLVSVESSLIKIIDEYIKEYFDYEVNTELQLFNTEQQITDYVLTKEPYEPFESYHVPTSYYIVDTVNLLLNDVFDLYDNIFEHVVYDKPCGRMVSIMDISVIK